MPKINLLPREKARDYVEARQQVKLLGYLILGTLGLIFLAGVYQWFRQKSISSDIDIIQNRISKLEKGEVKRRLLDNRTKQLNEKIKNITSLQKLQKGVVPVLDEMVTILHSETNNLILTSIDFHKHPTLGNTFKVKGQAFDQGDIFKFQKKLALRKELIKDIKLEGVQPIRRNLNTAGEENKKVPSIEWEIQFALL